MNFQKFSRIFLRWRNLQRWLKFMIKWRIKNLSYRPKFNVGDILELVGCKTSFIKILQLDETPESNPKSWGSRSFLQNVALLIVSNFLDVRLECEWNEFYFFLKIEFWVWVGWDLGFCVKCCSSPEKRIKSKWPSRSRCENVPNAPWHDLISTVSYSEPRY